MYDGAKKFYDHDSEEVLECNTEPCDGHYVKYDGDKVCTECGHVPTEREYADDTLLRDRQWEQFWSQRNETANGFYGPERARFVGGVSYDPDTYKDA